MTAPGLNSGRYEVLDLLGEGGHASVYRVRDRTLAREVAMKVLLPQFTRDTELLDRFAGEADALAHLQHPNIVTVYDIGRDPHWPFFTMDLIDGPTFADLVESGRGLPVEMVVSLMKGLCSALDYLHQHRLVHRDVKAANVMLGRGGRVVLMDFGIARVLDNQGFTREGASLGTPEAMAPEQVLGQPVGPAADIYSTGILAYQLLAGEPPFFGDTGFVLHAHAHEPPPALQYLRPDLSPGVYAAVEQALAKEPSDRPATASAFAAALAAAVGPAAQWVDPYQRAAQQAPAIEPVRPEQPAHRVRPFTGVPIAAVIMLGLCSLALLLSLVIGLIRATAVVFGFVAMPMPAAARASPDMTAVSIITSPAHAGSVAGPLERNNKEPRYAGHVELVV